MSRFVPVHAYCSLHHDLSIWHSKHTMAH